MKLSYYFKIGVIILRFYISLTVTTRETPAVIIQKT